ncbi:MAG TPA: pectin acetylesterase-family hydrolase [Ilumatobacteraceae bacterium]
MRRLTASAIAVILAALTNACSDSTTESTSPPLTTASPVSTASPTTASTTSTAPASTTTEASTTSTLPDYTNAAWTRVDAPSDCMCSDGSPYAYWVRTADPTKVVFFMQGGGACFSAETCAAGSGTYKATVTAGDDPGGFASGIWDFTDARNPFTDWSFVFVPYCTGDLHLGTATQQYSPDVAVHHNGSVNATTALDDLAAQFPDATQVVVAGESAGSAPTPLYAAMTHDRLPDADVTVLADGSGAYPDAGGINAVLAQLWGAEVALPRWPEVSGLTIADWSLPDLFVRASEHDPEIIFGRHDYAYDGVQQFFAGLAGIPGDDLVSLIDGNEALIEQGGVDLHSYISPGDSHTVLSRPEFYTETTEGVALVDWVADLVRRRPDLDVHCTDCKVPG